MVMNKAQSLENNPFSKRHIGPSEAEQATMLAALDVPSLEALIQQIIPSDIQFNETLDVPDGVGEEAAMAELKTMMQGNVIAKSFIGQGYHDCLVPPVILRNLLESPGWYTSYTPYQPEISQGRLEMLFHFQTLITELTGLPVANASLLDEATAIAEAVGIALKHSRGKKTEVVVANDLHPQSLDVLLTRGNAMGFSIDNDTISDKTCAIIIQSPDTYGVVADHSAIIDEAKKAGALVIVCADPLALTLLEAPAKWGADIVVGCIQRFGVPMGNGGPHAAFLGVCESLTRLIPGRIIGESIDKHGRPAYRLALQTREQHIRREKATSNICTAQALLANMAAAYAIWHGPKGLIAIAQRVHELAVRLALSLQKGGLEVHSTNLFDTVTFKTSNASALQAKAEAKNYLLRVIGSDNVSVAFDELSTEQDLQELCEIFGVQCQDYSANNALHWRNTQNFLSQEIFHSCRSETQMKRLLRNLANKDLALDRTMIPLGSCTMKLNSTAEMIPVTWPEVSQIHPFSPANHRQGYQKMIADLDHWLSDITGFAKVSLQPNAGSQGEFSGLLAIKQYHESNNQGHRSICLIPSSAHGTNPASAQMAGYDVVVVKCTQSGDVDVEDLKLKAEKHSNDLAALMITYPSTHGVFETSIKNICKIIHDNGGQIYFDGANLNAMVGLSRPGDIGADVCHLNLHKTFCIPHGGGGPGIGPIGVAPHLVPFLPGHIEEGTHNAVSAAPYGSASILPITWMYIRMLGAQGLKNASEIAILNANYLAKSLESHYPILYTGNHERVGHECILDTRPLKTNAGVTVDDVAKRLIDLGFHAPTMSWPVIGTLMVEPTESENLHELDRFIDAMIVIRKEADEIQAGTWPKDDNPLCNAPHPAEDLLKAEWDHPYSREQAAYPSVYSERATKFWPPVSRVDNQHGDRNLICACPPMSDFADD